MKKLNSDNKDLEFLANKSKEVLDKQIQAYRQHHSNSGIIITILSLFIPIFFDKISNSNCYFKLAAVLPLILIVISIIKLIQVLTSKELYQGSNFIMIENSLNDNYEQILLNEIGSNKSSFEDNQVILKSVIQNYNWALKLTVAAIVLAFTLLFTNQFYS